MIPPEERYVDGVPFRKVCRSADVTERQGLRVELSLHQDVALFRVDAVVRAINNICPHKHQAVLCNGLVKEGTVQCPLHGWTYDICTGASVVGSSGLRTYSTIEENGYVWLEVIADEKPSWASW
jgi:nitrite reductase (NADH) small subunit